MTESISNISRIHTEIPSQSRFSARVNATSEGLGYSVGAGVRTLMDKFQSGELFLEQPLPPNVVLLYPGKTIATNRKEFPALVHEVQTKLPHVQEALDIMEVLSVPGAAKTNKALNALGAVLGREIFTGEKLPPQKRRVAIVKAAKDIFIR